MKRRVVVTGMGVLSPIGNTLAEFRENLKAGVCGKGPGECRQPGIHEILHHGNRSRRNPEEKSRNEPAEELCRARGSRGLFSLLVFRHDAAGDGPGVSF